MDLGLSGKTAVVAGGSRGCGRGISEVLAAEGAAVVFSGRQRGPVTATETALLAAGGKTVGVVADMTTRESALAIIRTAQEHFGDPDILVVNSPGAVPDPVTGRWRGFENSSDADFEEIYRNFVMSLVYLTRAVLPGMKANRMNQGHAELSACLHLPDGRAAVMFSRPRITGNCAAAGGLSWKVIRPFEEITLRYACDMIMLADPRSLTDPKAAFTLGQREPAVVSLTIRGAGSPPPLASIKTMSAGSSWPARHTVTINFSPGHQDWSVRAFRSCGATRS